MLKLTDYVASHFPGTLQFRLEFLCLLARSVLKMYTEFLKAVDRQLDVVLLIYSLLKVNYALQCGVSLQEVQM